MISYKPLLPDSMIRFRPILLTTLLVLALVAGADRLRGHGKPGPSPMVSLAGESEGDENPASRAEWEFARLRDPATGEIPEGIHRAELEFASRLPRSGEAFAKGSAALGLDWQQRGPYNIGGRTRALALDMDGEDTILAGGVSGGMWRSTNGGATWKRTTLLTQVPSVTCVTQDPRPGKHNIWYYGTGEIVGSSPSGGGAYYGGDGIFKSTDRGLTWNALPATSTGKPHQFDSFFDYVWRVVVDPSNTTQDELYAATYGGIMRSTNGGLNWTNALVDALSRYSADVDVAITDSGVVYATLSSEGGRKGIYRSTNGTQWTNITPPNWPASYRRTVIGIAPSNQNVVYFLSETPGSGNLGRDFRGDSSWSSLWKYTYVSGNGAGSGGVWENRSANIPNFGGSFGDYNSQTSYDMHIDVKPDNPNVLFVGGTNLYRSTDAFSTPSSSSWIGGYRDIPIDSTVRLQLEYPNHHPDQHSLVFSRGNPNVVLTSSDGGIHKTLDIMAPTVEWRSLDNGYTTSQFYTIALDRATPGDQFLIGGLQDNGTWLTTSPNATEPWKWTGSGDGAWCAVAGGKSSIYVSKQEGKIYRVLVDGNGEATGSTRIDPRGGGKYLFIDPFALDPSDNNMMYLIGGSYLWRNSDLTAIPLGSTDPATVNWQRLDSTHPLGADERITSVGASAASPAHRVYYGTDSGRVYRIDEASAGSPAPADITGAKFPRGGYVTCVAVDPENGDRAVAVFSNYNVQSLFLTTDAGATWTQIGGNLEPNDSTGIGPGPSCRWFSFLHRGGGTLYLVGTSTGLYSTTNLNGTSTVWAQEGPETIGNTVVDMIDVRPSDGMVAIATHGSGVFTTTVAPLGVEEPVVAGRAALELGGSYPNPAVSEATIAYTVPSSAAMAPVELELFDATGRVAVTLVDGAMPPGRHSARLDLLSYPGALLPSGRYYYRLRIGDAVASRAMEIVR